MLTWTEYNSTRIAVYYNNDGNKDIYQSLMRNIGGRWNNRMRGGIPGWLVPIEKRDELLQILDNLKAND